MSSYWVSVAEESECVVRCIDGSCGQSVLRLTSDLPQEELEQSWDPAVMDDNNGEEPHLSGRKEYHCTGVCPK